MIQNISDIWDKNTGQWIANWKNNYAYDLTCNLSDLIVPSIDLIGWWPAFSNNITNKPMEYTYSYWIEGSTDWLIGYKFFYFYSKFNNVNEPFAEIAKIFPNPFSNYLSFDFSVNFKLIIFELYDITGQKVMVEEISDKSKIFIEGINSGMYFYKLYANGKKQSGKLILK